MLKFEQHLVLGGGLIKVFSPTIEYYIDIVRKGNLYFVKMNHAWWQYLAGKKFWLSRYHKLHDKELISEVKDIIKNIDKSDIVMAVSDVGPLEHIGKFKKKQLELEEVMIRHMPDNYQPHFGCIWKKYVLQKKISKFFNCINDYEVIVVGLEHLKEVETTLKFSNFLFHQIYITSSKNNERQKVLDDLLNIADKPGKKIFLIQAGELFATWLVYHLRYKTKNDQCSFIDIGRAIDAFCPTRKVSQEMKKTGVFTDFKHQLWMSRKI